MNDSIMVSVCCITYNHKNYIRKCLDGFIMQKTNFKYEVIVHDDASTDGTADIIHEYAEKYPEIIKPIFQSENQYSKHVPITKTFIYPKMRGKYVAFCEGDDYWTDEYKLQLQFDIMEAHPSCSLCTHKVIAYHLATKTKELVYPRCRFTLEEGVLDKLIQTEIMLKGVCFHLTSLFIRKSSYDIYVLGSSLNRDFLIPGDVSLHIFFAINGEVFFIDKIMSIHNDGVEGSWTLRVENNNSNLLRHYQNMIAAYNFILTDFVKTDFQKQCILERICDLEGKKSLLENDFKAVIKNHSFFKSLTLKRKLSILIGCYFPHLLKLYRKLKKHGK